MKQLFTVWFTEYESKEYYGLYEGTEDEMIKFCNAMTNLHIQFTYSKPRINSAAKLIEKFNQ